MARVLLRIVAGPEDAARARSADMKAALEAKPELVFVGNTGRTPIKMYERWAQDGLDLSGVRLRMLDAYLTSPSRGFDDAEHEGCFTRFVVDRILAPLAPEHRPRDWTIPPEDVTTCEEIDEALEEQPENWSRLRHPISGEHGAEFVISEQATGALARVRRACEAYERLMQRETLDLVSLGIGPKPYPHMAFNCGPYTRPDAPTHLTLLDEASREANAGDFGDDPELVPPYSITTGPGTLLGADKLWVTALGANKSEAVAWSFADPNASDFEFRSSIGYALRARELDLLLDEAAAADLLEDANFERLAERYAQAGHELTARRS